VGSAVAVGECRPAREACAAAFGLGFGLGFEVTTPLPPVGEAAGRAVTGADSVAAVCVGDGARTLGVEVDAVPGAGVARVALTTGASGLGAPAALPPVAGGDTVGAVAIRGDASLRGPLGGSSGDGADAAQAGPASIRARVAAHAEAHTPLRRSVRRRDDVLVDIRPSLSR
jgi:hypothetical protein